MKYTSTLHWCLYNFLWRKRLIVSHMWSVWGWFRNRCYPGIHSWCSGFRTGLPAHPKLVVPSLPTESAVELWIPFCLHRALHPPHDKPMGVRNIRIMADLLAKEASQLQWFRDGHWSGALLDSSNSWMFTYQSICQISWAEIRVRN